MDDVGMFVAQWCSQRELARDRSSHRLSIVRDLGSDS